MSSSRAEDVAEVLWELKRADKVATYSTIANRAGFSAGTNGRAVQTALRVVRRDWPHLQWWRAVKDDGSLPKGSEHEEKLRECGIELSEVTGKVDIVRLTSPDDVLMHWEEPHEQPAAS